MGIGIPTTKAALPVARGLRGGPVVSWIRAQLRCRPVPDFGLILAWNAYLSPSCSLVGFWPNAGEGIPCIGTL